MCAAVCLLLLLYRKTYCDAAKDSSSILPVFRSSLQNKKKRGARDHFFFLSGRSVRWMDPMFIYIERRVYREQKKKQTGRKEGAAHRVQLKKKGGLNRSTAARWLARKWRINLFLFLNKIKREREGGKERKKNVTAPCAECPACVPARIYSVYRL